MRRRRLPPSLGALLLSVLLPHARPKPRAGACRREGRGVAQRRTLPGGQDSARAARPSEAAPVAPARPSRDPGWAQPPGTGSRLPRWWGRESRGRNRLSGLCRTPRPLALQRPGRRAVLTPGHPLTRQPGLLQLAEPLGTRKKKEAAADLQIQEYKSGPWEKRTPPSWPLLGKRSLWSSPYWEMRNSHPPAPKDGHS